MSFVRDATELGRVIAASGARRLIFYGHAVGGGQALLLSTGHSIEPWKLAQILKGSGVTDFDILGCEGTSIAAQLSLSLPTINIGYLRSKRYDNVEVDRYTGQVKNRRIDEQPLYHFPARAR